MKEKKIVIKLLSKKLVIESEEGVHEFDLNEGEMESLIDRIIDIAVRKISAEDLVKILRED